MPVSEDLLCFSHVRWRDVFQRPQQLMSRAARDWRVFFVEEPIPGESARFLHHRTDDGVRVCVPTIPTDVPEGARHALVGRMLAELLDEHDVAEPVHWVWSPRMLPISRAVPSRARVYDCMDELAAVRSAPPELPALERELMACSDLVFTGGVSLWEKRRDAHASVHLFPSSVDRDHFGSARRGLPAPPDLAAIPRPRLGWAGVLDERFDGALVAEAARLRPDWHWILLGPTARIDPAELPKATNLHYLGPRPYADLPAYLGHVDVGVMPFARNAATRYISPTKTPEYLAAGLPVVSTPIADVVRTFGTAGLVHVAGTAEGFVRACEAAMTDGPARRKWQAEVDAWLAQNSWDDTWARMHALVVGLSS